MKSVRKEILDERICRTDFIVYETVVYSVRHKFYGSALRVYRDNTLKIGEMIRSELKKYENI